MMPRKFIVLVLSLLFLCSPASFAEERGFKTTSPDSQKANILGNYYAFIVGINAYEEWYPLKTAVKDAQVLKELLINQYSFEKVLLIIDKDATQLNVIDSLKEFAASLNEDDNLLIYYAGHGQLDEFTGDGYWIPVDGKHKNAGSWISHLMVKSILSSERVKAKNIALISDSCYAGALLRSGPSPVSTDDDKYQGKILALSARKSRQVFTSGGLEPVADGGRDGHSLFAYYFLKALMENRRDIIDLENLFYSQVWGPVAEIGDQRPYVGRLKTLMDENGQFVLITRSAKDKDWDQLVDPKYASISTEQYHKPATKPLFNPTEPWTGVWDVHGSIFCSGRWRMIQTGNIVSSTKDSAFEFKGKIRGNQIKGRFESSTDATRTNPFAIKISPDGLSFKGTFDISWQKNLPMRGRRATEWKIATVSPAKFNATTPWTGKWKVEGSPALSGIWAMKQSGRIVKSTKDSYYEFEGKITGNQLKGRIEGDYGFYSDVVLNISSDGQSFNGTWAAASYGGRTGRIKGKRE